MRPLIVGMNNPISSRPEYALYPWPRGCAGNRLFEMLRDVLPSATMHEYVKRFERVNLVSGRWHRATARSAARALRPSLTARSVVLLGREVAEAFEISPSYPSGTPAPDGAIFYLMPHPSGRNRQYNDPEVRHAAGCVLARLYTLAIPFDLTRRTP